MEKKITTIHKIPAIIWGTPSDKVFLYVHGQGGNKEEAIHVYDEICSKGYQMVSLDLPEHGSRKEEKDMFDPWHAIPELKQVMEYLREHWEQVSLYANSIGAWFSMLSFGKEQLEQCLFVSPVLDMKQLISNMMMWAGVSEEQLEKERVIPTSFGQTLYWEYWQYVLAHPITEWNTSTRILYGDKDHLVERRTVDLFVEKFHCDLTVMEGGEHWFHTEEQLAFLREWVAKN